jgi:hypothetical protein
MPGEWSRATSTLLIYARLGKIAGAHFRLRGTHRQITAWALLFRPRTIDNAMTLPEDSTILPASRSSTQTFYSKDCHAKWAVSFFGGSSCLLIRERRPRPRAARRRFST